MKAIDGIGIVSARHGPVLGAEELGKASHERCHLAPLDSLFRTELVVGRRVAPEGNAGAGQPLYVCLKNRRVVIGKSAAGGECRHRDHRNDEQYRQPDDHSTFAYLHTGLTPLSDRPLRTAVRMESTLPSSLVDMAG